MSEEFESFFGDTDVDDIPDNPNELPNNTYKFQVISAILKPTQDGTKTGITFKYQIVEGAWATFFPITDWIQIPEPSMPKAEKQRMLSFLKMRLKGFGYSDEEIQKFGPKMVNDCVNRTFYGTTWVSKKKDGNTQIRVQKFDPIDGGFDGSDDFDIM